MRLAIPAPRSSERPKLGHDLLHMDETVLREQRLPQTPTNPKLKPKLNFSRHRPPFDYGPLITSLKNAIDEKGLQPVPIFIKKNIELYEMICADAASVSRVFRTSTL